MISTKIKLVMLQRLILESKSQYLIRNKKNQNWNFGNHYTTFLSSIYNSIYCAKN